MPVGPLSGPARDYVAAFSLSAIVLWRDNRLGVCKNPAGAEAVWWCASKDAGAVIRAANTNGRDVVAAAARLHIPLTPHAVVAQRATEAVDRIDAALKTAQRRGDLVFFNGLYRARRQAAAARGAGFMSYGIALRRLRKAVAGVAAHGGELSRPLMVSVFDDVKP